MSGAAQVFSTTVPVRYCEVDQQGVVFHMWYLAYLEDARNAYLSASGLALRQLLELGCDLQVVHSQMDWAGSVHWGDQVAISVSPARVGTTSFSLAFDLRVSGSRVLGAETTYVTVGRDGGKCRIPMALREVLDNSAKQETALA